MCHVLIIEDEPLVAIDLQDMLAAAGATSFAFAETEDDAIAEARAHRPDVITSDVMLREGTGPHAVAAILSEGGPCPVIFITGTPEACDDCDPPAQVLSKPVVSRAVSEAFQRVAPHPTCD
ncbi:response regulator [Sphingomonas immobilis]|uniref:Response regulator n=1 Tax=Sphingomonas immobilis TaxID=3063997 RepID=A0ABT9A521_9SPHN|nr:response regulator [Sphingomonas sp. CA1-15]MDO7843832.1 response regulator [Sphingomonas sp. CA1-15]